LNRVHHFTEKRFQQREPVYQYQPLFRKFLLEKAAATLLPEQLANLRHCAAILLEGVSQIEAAVGLYRENADWQELTRLIMDQAPLLLQQGRNLLLEKWLTAVPSQIFENDPWFHYWIGACCFPLNPSRSQSYLKCAFEQFKERDDASGMFLTWSGLVDAITFEFEDLTQLDPLIQEFENLKDEYIQLPSEEIKGRVTTSMFLALLLRQPQNPDLEKWAEKSVSVINGDIDENIKAMALFNLLHHRIMGGQFDKAEYTLYKLNRLAEAPTTSPLTQIRAKFAATCYYQGNGSHTECLKVMNEGLKISKKTGVSMMDTWLLMYGIASTLNYADDKTGEQLLEKLSTYANRMTPWEMAVYHFLLARKAMIQGNFKQAGVHANLGLELAEKVGAYQKLCWPLLLKAQVMHGLHKHKEANDDLQRVITIAHDTKSNLFKFHAHMLEAQFAYERNNPIDGLNALRRALTLGKEQKYLNCFVDQPVATAKLCARALEAGIEVEYVQEIIRHRHLIPDEPPVHLENWPWALKIYTLGRFGLLRDGKPVQFTRKAQEKPLALLKALIAFGGREVHEEQITDALWSEADGDFAHKSFATTLWRLRKLIGYPDAIQLRDRKLALDPRYCWVDVWAFERIIRQAESAWKKGMEENDMAFAISMIQNALHVYQGPFLAAEVNGYWGISLRERLQSRFLRTIKRLCEYWKQTGQQEKAVECFQRSLEVDDLAEEIYDDLMSCYLHLGRKADALALYERYKETLSAKLGLEPSPEADRLRKAIVSERGSKT
jgi:DNA-binding SARP family transcriptional activator